MKATPKQIAVVSDQLGRCLHYLDELGEGVHYVVLIEGIPKMFANTTPLHAAKIIERQWLLNNKVEEYEVEQLADKQTGWKSGETD